MKNFQHKHWHFQITELKDGLCRVKVVSTTTAHRVHFSWIAYRSLAEDKELCVAMLKQQLEKEIEYVTNC